jgi:hypothetical protein
LIFTRALKTEDELFVRGVFNGIDRMVKGNFDFNFGWWVILSGVKT